MEVFSSALGRIASGKGVLMQSRNDGGNFFSLPLSTKYSASSGVARVGDGSGYRSTLTVYEQESAFALVFAADVHQILGSLQMKGISGSAAAGRFEQQSHEMQFPFISGHGIPGATKRPSALEESPWWTNDPTDATSYVRCAIMRSLYACVYMYIYMYMYTYIYFRVSERSGSKASAGTLYRREQHIYL